MIRREDAWPLGAIAFVLAVSAAWWGFALWSVPGAPDWVERARSVCFNLTETGLPDAKGWLLLIGEPPTMLLALFVGWGREVRASVAHLWSSRMGRALELAVAALVLGGLGLAGARVASARLPEVAWGEPGSAPADQPRLERAWPEAAGLVDQMGAPFTLASLAGRPAMVTFAFGHCETLCPVVVHQALGARAELEGGGADAMSLVVLTLDPWRDTPSRLASLHTQFGLDPERDFVVGGSIEQVESALDGWGVARTRDARTGDIVHAGIVYLVEADGTLAYGVTGGVEQLVRLAERLRG